MNREDLLAELPAPHDDEPPSLRSDIVDELLDHLQCAFRREVLKDGDEGAAEKRVLDRFGDPRKLARRLWRQAMWSRIMGKRILSGLQWLLTLAAVFLAGAVFWQQSALLTEIQTARKEQRAEQQALAVTLNRLFPAQPAAAVLAPGEGPGMTDGATITPAGGGMSGFPGEPSPGKLVVRLTQDSESKRNLVTSNLQLRGRSNHRPARITPLTHKSEAIAGAMFEFEHLVLDRYELAIELPDGQKCTKSVVIHDANLRTVELSCPPSRNKVPVRITVPPLPDDLRDAGWKLNCSFDEQALVKTKMADWKPAQMTSYYVRFDPQTGQINWLQEGGGMGGGMGMGMGGGMGGGLSKTANLSQVNDADRLLFLLTGPVLMRFQLTLSPGPGGSASLASLESVTWPPMKPGERYSPLTRTVEPGENVWELELPEDLIAAARKRMAERDKPSALADSPAEEKPFGPPPGDAPLKSPTVKVIENEAKPPLGDRGRVTVRLTNHTKDGPVVGSVNVTLVDENQVPAVRQLMIQPDAQGRCEFERIEPGRYLLEIQFGDGRLCRAKLPVLRAGKELVEEVVCPPPATKTSVLATAPPIPEDLRRAGLYLGAAVFPCERKFEGRIWGKPNGKARSLIFQPETGQLAQADNADLSQDAPEDRLAFVPAGPYRLQLTLNYVTDPKDGNRTILLADWPSDPRDDPDQPDLTAEAGEENRWDIKPADEFWKTARKALAEFEDAATKAEDDDAPPAGEKSSTNSVSGASLRLVAVGEYDDKPVKDVRVTLYCDTGDLTAIPDEIETKSIDKLGAVSFSGLKPGLHYARITSLQNRLSSTFRFDLVNGQATGNAILMPTSVLAASLTFRTNLPDDLAQANVKLCFRINSTSREVNRQHWAFVGELFENYVVGPRGYEGMLQLPRVRRDQRPAFVEGRHRMKPSAEREITVPVLPLSVYELALICPAPRSTDPDSQPDDSRKEQWIVCATPTIPKREHPNEVPFDSPASRFTPVELRPNEWVISIPEDMIATARKRLAELEGKPKDETDDAPKGTEDGAAVDAGAGTITIFARRETAGLVPVPNMKFAVWPMNGDQRLNAVMWSQTDAEGKAVLAKLEPGRYQINVGVPDGGCNGFWDFRIRPGDNVVRQVLVPVVPRVPVKLTTSLPKELAEAGVRLCVTFRPETAVRHGVEVHASQPNGLGWSVSYLVGPEGPGIFRTRTHRTVELDRPKFSGKFEPAESDDGTIELPAVRLRVASLGLIGPTTLTEQDKKKTLIAEGETIWEYLEQAKESKIQNEFLPAADQKNEWHIQIPDDVLLPAWRKLAELDKKPE